MPSAGPCSLQPSKGLSTARHDGPFRVWGGSDLENLDIMDIGHGKIMLFFSAFGNFMEKSFAVPNISRKTGRFAASALNASRSVAVRAVAVRAVAVRAVAVRAVGSCSKIDR